MLRLNQKHYQDSKQKNKDTATISKTNEIEDAINKKTNKDGSKNKRRYDWSDDEEDVRLINALSGHSPQNPVRLSENANAIKLATHTRGQGFLVDTNVCNTIRAGGIS